MRNVVRLDSLTCQRCGLHLSLVREREAITLRYDMGAWERQCERKECDTPAACPWLAPDLHPHRQEEAENPPLQVTLVP